MLGRYYENESSSRAWKKTTIAMVGVVALVGIIGTIAMVSAPESKLLSVLNAEQQEFDSYMSAFGKAYKSDEEYSARFKAFRDNLAYIRVFNSMKNTVILGVNNLADLEFEEFKRIYLPRKMPVREAVNPQSFEGVSVPATVDWRTQGAVTPVKDQGQCGSCWSFSTTGSVEGAWKLSGKTLVSLSEQQLVDCSWAYGNQGCNGGLMDDAFKYIIANKGLTTEANYAYTAKDGLCNKSKASAVAASISSYTDVTPKSMAALQAAVAQQPVSIAVDAAGIQWQLYKSGTITTACGTSLDHGVLAVGYDTTASPNFWIVKNSWSTSWGMQGYLQIGMQDGNGVCGINMQPSYPVV
jgi:C1A family cysteine protease